MTGSAGISLDEVRQAIRLGRTREARTLLLQETRRNPSNHQAWLWLAGLTASPRQSLEFVRRAQALRPNDPKVVKARIWAEDRLNVGASQSARQSRQDTSAASASEASLRIRGSSTDVSQQGKDSGRRLLFWVSGGLLIGACVLSLVVVGGLAVSNWLDSQAVFAAARSPSVARSDPRSELISEPSAESQGMSVQEDGSSYEPPIQPTPTSTQNPIRPKPILAGSVLRRSTWTPTPLPTNTPTPSPTPMPTFVSELGAYSVLQPAGLAPGEKWIDVTLDRQTLIAYEGNVPVFESLVSTGTSRHPTVVGQFRIWMRYSSQDMDGYRLGYDYFLRNVPFVQYFYQDYALHGTFWHSNFGTPMSHGCVNLPTPAAEWLFNWADYGTLVNIHR